MLNKSTTVELTSCALQAEQPCKVALFNGFAADGPLGPLDPLGPLGPLGPLDQFDGPLDQESQKLTRCAVALQNNLARPFSLLT